jgi:hypothetical protein
LAEIKEKIQANKRNEAEILLSILDKFPTKDIYIFSQPAKVSYLKTNWAKVKFWRVQYNFGKKAMSIIKLL